MDRILIRGGAQLAGEVRVSGSKNATLALMSAALLARGETVLRNVPAVRDVEHMGRARRRDQTRCRESFVQTP